jgi:hypothetical protein
MNQALKSQSSTGVIIVTSLVLFTFIFVLFTYTFLHESGHALAGILFGQRLTEFQINFLKWDAHVGMVGHVTEGQRAVQSVAGAALPLFVWFVLINFAPRKADFSFEMLKVLGSMVVLNTLLVWILLPVLYLLGKAPPDDVTNFLRFSQMPPVLLILTVAILYGRGWALFLSKIDGLRNALLVFSKTDQESLTAGTRTTLTWMAGILASVILLTLVLNNVVADPSLNSFSPPEDFQPVAEIDLSKQAYAGETLAEFTLEKATYVGVFITIRDIDTTYFDFAVSGAHGFRSTVIHGEGYRAEQDGGLWEQNLPPGTYQLVLTSHESTGTVAVYLKAH